jgi:hypothetical protein
MLRLLAVEPQRRVRAVDGTCVFVDVSEHRIVTVAFLRFEGADALVARGPRRRGRRYVWSAEGRSGLADATRGERMIATVAAGIGAWSAASPIRSPIKAHCRVYLVKTT